VPTAKEINELWAEYAPRIAAAKERDGQDKHELFLPWYEEEINGLPAVQLTPERYLLLSVSNALIGEKLPSFSSVLRFLWIVSPQFSESKWRARFFRWRHRNIDPEETCEAIMDYLKRAFKYSPPQKVKFGDIEGEKKEGSGEEWISTLLDLTASEYGWEMEKIMRMPISILFLLCCRIRSRFTGKPVSFSSEADALQSEYLKEINGIKEASA
jgi:hypothetical protein